jgi:hypothetical protein
MTRFMNEVIDELYKHLKEGKPYRLLGADYDLADRSERITVVDIIADNYSCSDRDLKRLSDFLVHEELTDKHPDKMSREEYPFFSETQLARRKYGVHRKNDGKGVREVPLELAENYGIDGKNYNYPRKRNWHWREGILIDDRVKIRNKFRRKQYNDFINGKSDGVFQIGVSYEGKTILDAEKYEKFYF